MGRTVRGLLTAAGLTPTAGHTFKNNVPGAAGAAVSYYKFDGAYSLQTSDHSYPTLHLSGEIFHFTWSNLANSHWGYIRRPTSEITVTDDDADPAQADIIAVDYESLTVKLHGKAGDPGFYDDITWHINLPPDLGSFNAPSSLSFISRIQRRGSIGGGGGYPPEYIPLSLSIADNGDGSATGTWSNTNQAGGVSTRVVWQSLSGGVWTTFDTHTVANGVGTHTQTGIASSTVVRFRAIYTNAGGDSSWGYATSGQVTVTGGGGSPPTDVPSGVTLSNTGGGNGRASWSNTNGSLAIEVQFYKDSESFGSPVQLAAGSTQTDKAYPASSEGMVDVYYYNGAGAGPAGSGGPANF